MLSFPDNRAPHGAVAYWNPINGTRHGLFPDALPQPGQQRQTLCGLDVVLGDPSTVDWLSPTCPDCWAKALSRRAARNS